MMSAASETQYHALLQKIQQHSPKASVWLELIYKNYGIQAGSYASVAIVWLHARREAFGKRALKDFSDRDMQDFTYYQEMQAQPEAIELFRNMLQAYLGEQQADSDAQAQSQPADV